MKKLSVLAGIIGLMSIAVACNSSTEESTSQPAPTEEAASTGIVMPESSELALLMRRMFDDNMAMRESILNGELPTEFPIEEYRRLHSANATEPEKITETYHAMADAYLESMNIIVSGEGGDAVEAFNNMVNACVGCHRSVSCPGPIPKIQKLRIKADEA